LKPIVLVVTTMRWLPTARLAVALADAGFTVETVCPAGHSIAKTTVIKRAFIYRGLTPLKSIMAAIEATKPDLLIPGDDLATMHLHHLHKQYAANARSSGAGKFGETICALIERSIGAPENFGVIDDRTAFMHASQHAGVRVPCTEAVDNNQALKEFAAKYGYPMVLKANGTSGGTGVRIVRNEQEARKALRTLQAPPDFHRAMKRAVFDRNTTMLGPSVRRTKCVVNAQAFVDGTEATSVVACWQGQVLAGLHFEVLQKTNPSGPATVLKRIAHPEMTAAAEKMARRLKLSGLHGFDFMLDAQRNAYLIEINPRITQVGHLNMGVGHDLPRALVSVPFGKEVQQVPAVTDSDIVALFPKEWLRDPDSPYLQDGYHDVPWDQPELVRIYTEKPSGYGVRKLVQRYLLKR
jgi:predicted ATP-grasp superfamily ATP-dependent carboligase